MFQLKNDGTTSGIQQFGPFGIPLHVTHMIKGGSDGADGGDSIIEVEIVEG